MDDGPDLKTLSISSPPPSQTWVHVPKPSVAGSAGSAAAGSSGDRKSSSSCRPQATAGPPLDPEELRAKLAQYALSGKVVGKYGSKFKHWIVMDSRVASDAATNSGVPLNDIATGTDFNQRVGQSIFNDHIMIKGRAIFHHHLTDPATTDMQQPFSPLRMILFMDRMPDIGLPAFMEVTGGTPSGFIGLTCNYGESNPSNGNTSAPMNYNTHGFRYNVLLDKVLMPKPDCAFGGYGLATTPGTADKWANAYFEHLVPIKMSTQWLDTSINTQSTHRLWMMFMQDSYGASIPLQSFVNIQWSWDLSFTDVQS